MNNDNNNITTSNYFDSPSDQSITGFTPLAPEVSVADSGIFTNPEEVSRSDRLEKAKNTKLYALTKLNNNANLDNSYTELPDGRVESNKNKIWNDLNDQEFQSMNAYAEQMKALSRDEQGNVTNRDGNAFLGRTRRFYDFNTKADGSDIVKLGLAYGDADSAKGRYIKYPSGEAGVDLDRLNKDVLYSNDVAIMLEAVTHGRKQALDNRVVKDRYADPFTTDALGGGSSEYYNSRESVFGAPTTVDMDLGAKLFQEYMAKLPTKYQNYATRKVSGSGAPLSKPNSLVNTASGFGATFVNELLVKPLDALGDLTGLYDLDTDGDTTGAVEDAFGYDSRAVEDTMENIGKSWDTASNEEVPVADRVRAVANGMLEAFTTPELLGTSFGALLSWVSPGMLLKGVGVGSKFALAAKDIDKLVSTGELAARAGKVQKAKAFMSVDGAKSFLTSQAGFITSSLGNVNKQYEEFVSNNGDVELEGQEKASWFAGRFAVQMVNQNLDKLVDFNVMKSPGVMKALVPAVKAMTEKEFLTFTKTMAKGVAKTSLGASAEAAQEYTQTSMELFNSRFGSEKFKDQDTFVKFLSNDENLREAGIAAIAGAGGSTQFELAGAVGSAANSAILGFGIESTNEDSGNPESDVSINEATAIRNAHKDAVMSSDAGNPTVTTYYSAQVSDDPELKARATTYASDIKAAVLNGSATVFNSDSEEPTDIDGLAKDIEVFTSEDGSINYEAIKAAAKKAIIKKGEEFTPTIDAKLKKAFETGKVIARIKTMSEVSGEVSKGVKGFLTYYSAAKAAEHSGDTKAYNSSLNKLESFSDYERTKLGRVNSELERVTGLVMAEAEMLVSQGKAPDMATALRIKGKEYGKRSAKNSVKTSVKNSSKDNGFTTYIHHYDVALNLQSKELGSQEYTDGIYNLVKTITAEVSAMDTAYKSLYSETSGEVSPTIEEVVAAQDAPSQTASPTKTGDATADISSAQADVDALNSAVDESEGEREYSLPEDIAAWVAVNPDSTYAKNIIKVIKDRKRLSAKAEGSIRAGIKTRDSEIENSVPVRESAEEDVDDSGLPSLDESVPDIDFDEMIFEDEKDLDDSNLPDLTDEDSVNDSILPSPSEDGEVDDTGFPDLIGDTDYSEFDERDFDVGNLTLPDFDNDNIPTLDEYILPSLNESIPDLNGDEDIADFNNTDEVVAEKSDTAVAFTEHNEQVKELKLKIKERKRELVEEGKSTKSEDIKGDYLEDLYQEKEYLDKVTESKFSSKLVDHVLSRIGALKDSIREKVFTLYKHYSTKNGAKTSKNYTFNIKGLFGDVKVTGFTLQDRGVDDIHPETKVFADRLVRNTARIPYSAEVDMEKFRFRTEYFKAIEENPATVLMFNVDGTPNYGNIEGMHAAVNEYLLRDGPNLFGLARTEEDIAEMFGIPETSVSWELSEAMMSGGTTLKLAAAAVGEGIIKNLGIKVKETQAKDALATSLGMSALKGYVGTALNDVAYVPSAEDKQNGMKATSIDMIIGNPELLKTLKAAKEANKFMEDTLGVSVKSGSTYRNGKKSKPRAVTIHNAPHQDAPKDHTDVVNRLENTAFKFNSGNAVLLKMFMNNKGQLDIKALIERIIGSKDGISNKDDMDSYEAQEFALERSLQAYVDATADVGNGNLFFDWFIAKNHRMHLDSTGINPQTDKHIARWLLTASNSSVDITLDDIDAVLEDNTGSMTAKTFAYAITQAFDGADGVPGVDKDSEDKILKSAKALLDPDVTSEERLYEMAKKADHIGHAALAIANIIKFRNSKGTFTSDMVMEVDGLTNGFAFRAMQFPVNSEESPVSMEEWLEKVGILREDSESGMYDLESMNSARDNGQDDVYISTGGILAKQIKGAKAKLIGVDGAWVKLFEKHKMLPDFSSDISEDEGLRKFIRNLMKSPVMIFGYAAGLDKISRGLVNDQVMGKGYLKGRGLVSFLTSVHPKTNKDGSKNELAGQYVLSETELLETFGAEDGGIYHQARVDLKKKSILEKDNSNTMKLRADLENAIGGLYTEPLKDTLELLFSEQTRVNAAFTTAGQFLFEGFSKLYSKFLSDKQDATEEDKTEWLRVHASLLPGVSGASSDDQTTKLTFLKNILESTDDDVIVGPGAGSFRRSANTVKRTFGDPGVGPAVLTILSLDSSVLARAINGYYKSTKSSADVVPVHDAIVLGVGDFGIIEEYSEEFYTTNRQYSIAEEFANAMDAFEKRFEPEIVADSFDVRDIKNERIPYAEMRAALDVVVADVKDGREWLFSSNIKSGQMVGPEGTMYKTDIVNERDKALKFLSGIESNVMQVLNDNSTREALGKLHKDVSDRLHNMLKGCK